MQLRVKCIRSDATYKPLLLFAYTIFLPRGYLSLLTYLLTSVAACKDKGPWIVKPVASSRGRGIFLISSVSFCHWFMCQ